MRFLLLGALFSLVWACSSSKEGLDPLFKDAPKRCSYEPEMQYDNGTLPASYDFEVIKSAKKTCKKLYPNSPCPKKVIKRAKHSYWVICAADKGEEGLLDMFFEYSYELNITEKKQGGR